MFKHKAQFRICLLYFLFSYVATISNAQILSSAENEGRVFYGKASFYGNEFAGNHTANGEIFRPALMTAAHRYWPFHTLVKVTNLNNSRSVIVRINDRGPFIEGRHLDVSKGVAEVLGFVRAGVADVRMEVISWGKNDPEMFTKMNDAQNSMLLSNSELKTPTKPSKVKKEVVNNPESAWNIGKNNQNIVNALNPSVTSKPDTDKLIEFTKLIENKIDNKVVEVPVFEKVPVSLNIAESIVLQKPVQVNNVLTDEIETTWNIAESNSHFYKEAKTPDEVKPDTEKIVAFAKSIEEKIETISVKPNPIENPIVVKSIDKKIATQLPTTKTKKTNIKDNSLAVNIPIEKNTKPEPKIVKSISIEKPSEVAEIKTTKESKKAPIEMKRSRWMCMDSDTLSGWCIQIGAFSLKSNALITYDKVFELTNDWVCIQEIDRSDMPLYRVIASKTMDYTSCKTNLEKIRTVYPEAFITSYVNLRLTANN